MFYSCGLEPITTCSPKNFDFVKSFGATHVFDYRSPTCGADIRKLTKNGLAHAIDCITEESSMKICYEAIGRAGGRWVGMDPYAPNIPASRKLVKHDWIVAFTVTGMPCNWPAPFEREATPELSEASVPFYDSFEQQLAEGKMRTHPARVNKGGLGAIPDGVGILRRKEISAQKLVYAVC